MSTSPVIGSDYMDLLPGDRIPAKGLAVMGGLLYEDGQLLGVLKHDLPRHPSIEYTLTGRGEYVRLWFVPLEEALGKAA